MAEMIQDSARESTAVREAIEEGDRKFMALYKQGDFAGVAELYTEDAIVMPPGMDSIQGKEGIQQLFTAFHNMGVAELVFHVVETGQAGEFALERSTFELLGQSGQELDRGKYIVIWKREQGVWKLFRDIFNSSMPAK